MFQGVIDQQGTPYELLFREVREALGEIPKEENEMEVQRPKVK